MSKMKVYGVHGLYEWKPVIKVGHATFSPHFSGGTTDKTGITPARYTSTNKVEQAIIENSDYYKSGRIFLLYQNGTDEEEQTPHDDAVVKEMDESKMDTMNFSSVNDACAYMMENYGYMRSQLPSKKAIQDAAKSQGFLITFNK